jgi:hypothetical protein
MSVKTDTKNHLRMVAFGGGFDTFMQEVYFDTKKL